MEYYTLLQFDREPFSNSPDPAFFYESAQHKECLQKLEIALRLRRGLNVVTGQVGTGKTTLCRQLLQVLSEDAGICASLLLDPDFPDARAFLGAVVQTVTGQAPGPDDSVPAMKEGLKHYLFRKGVEEGRTVALIVDEGQKMSPAALETLRELLNFETNEHKLFQVIIFAQTEFSDILDNRPNLADRINLYFRLGPLDFKETRALIRHRIRLAGGAEAAGRRLFSRPALWRIFRLSGGYPRKIIHLCHQCLLAMIIQDRNTVGRRMVGACARRTFVRPRPFRVLPAAGAAVVLAALGLGVWHYAGGIHKTPAPVQPGGKDAVAAPIPPEESAPGSNGNQVASGETEGSTAAGDASPALANPAQGTRAADTVEIHPAEDFPPPGIEEKIRPVEGAEILGTVPVAVGDTLGGLVQKIYGAYTYRRHQAVLAANPQLEDPDALKTGQRLIFPAISADMADAPGTSWWVSLSRAPDLAAAVAGLREEMLEGLPLRVLAVRAADGEISFRIVLKRCFENMETATLEKERLAPAGEVVCLEREEGGALGAIGDSLSASVKNHGTSNIERPTSNDE